MFALVLLLAPLIDSAPQTHSHGPPPPCDTTICRVSDQTLNSALSTFLCFTEERTSAMEEIDKKRELAAAIAPYLDGSREEELVVMGSESLVSLVNLVLHAGSDKVVKKTKRQHLKDLLNNLDSAGNYGLTPDILKKVNPILLGLMNCQTKTIAEIVELTSPTAGGDRAGRGGFVNRHLQRLLTPFFGVNNKNMTTVALDLIEDIENSTAKLREEKDKAGLDLEKEVDEKTAVLKEGKDTKEVYLIKQIEDLIEKDKAEKEEKEKAELALIEEIEASTKKLRKYVN